MTLSVELLLSLSDEMLILVDPRTLHIIQASPSVTKWLQFSKNEIEGKLITDIECALADVFFWQSVQSGEFSAVVNGEGIYQDANGGTLTVEKTVQRFELGDKSVIGIRARVSTESKVISDALEQVTASLQSTLESTADGILVTDLQGRIINLNRRFAHLWSLSDTILAQRQDKRVYRAMAKQLFGPTTWRSLIEDVRQARDADTFHSLTLKSRRFLESRSKPFVVRGQLSGRVFTFTDITERMRTQTELQAARDQAVAASGAKTQFLNHMSHELRTPLNAIIGFAQIIKDDAPAKQREDADHILQAGWHLLALVNEALDLGKVEAGRMEVTMQNVCIDEIASACTSLTEQLAKKRGIRIWNNITHTHQYVKGDPLRLRQIVLNLVSNAIKYGRDGGNVWLSSSHDERGPTYITIRDDGTGISSEDQAKLFQEFSRVGENQQHVEGTGIGLAVSQKMALLMGGMISVQSKVTEGSCFTLRLEHVESPTNESSPVSGMGTAPATFLADKTVLYIDDDDTNRAIFSIVLKKKLGAGKVILAASGKEGIERAQTVQPDVIVSDMNLGDMTGMEILVVLKADPRTTHIPIMAFSGSGTREEIEIAKKAGFLHYLMKPLQIQELADALRAMIAHTEHPAIQPNTHKTL